MLIFRNLCPNSFFKTSQQTNRHPKDEHFVGEAANPKIGPLKAPFIVSNWWPNFFSDKESILKSSPDCSLQLLFNLFWRGIERLQVFLWPSGKKPHHFFANITVKQPPPPKKDPLETPRAVRVVCCGVFPPWRRVLPSRSNMFCHKNGTILSLRIQSPSQMVIGVYNHLLRKVFRFHYHSQKVIGSLGFVLYLQTFD